MDDIPSITVRVDASGALVGVQVEGRSEPRELIETKPSEPTPSFGDEYNRPLARPWLHE